MLKLIAFPPAFAEPSASAFCVKAMCFLKMSGVTWEPEYTGDPRKLPNAKLPVLRVGEKLIPDSSQIRSYLETCTGLDCDEGLSRCQRAISQSIVRMVEEHLYFAIVCDRWLKDDNWQHVKKEVLDHIPFPFHGLITAQIRKQARLQVWSQGMARHSEPERLERAKLDLQAIQALLADKPFLFGDQPTAADAGVVPMLRAAAFFPGQSGVADLVNAHKELRDYMARGRAVMYPEP